MILSVIGFLLGFGSIQVLSCPKPIILKNDFISYLALVLFFKWTGIRNYLNQRDKATTSQPCPDPTSCRSYSNRPKRTRINDNFRVTR